MNKVICDVCGTAYPDTADVCPICGCAKAAAEQTEAENVAVEETAERVPSKGGRFSKSNVRKRNKASGNRGDDGEGANKGLVVAVVLLLLAIVAVLIYIGVRFLGPKVPQLIPNNSSSSSSSQNDQDQDNGGSSSENTNQNCTALKLSSSTVELEAANMSWQLSVEKTPAEAVEPLTFASSDEKVATVDANGNIVSVGPGEAIITVTCGEVSAQCKVVCTFEDESGSSEEEGGNENQQVELPVDFELTLNLKKYAHGYEFSFTEKYPDPVRIYNTIGDVKATDITWTSDNEEVATIDANGVVTAVGKGYTTVHGTIGEHTVSCKVNVSFTPQNVTKAKYKISHEDVTLYLGGNETFSLRLTDPENNGAPVDVTWTVNEEGYVEIDGRTIRAIKLTSDLKNKYVLVSATVEDYTYTCKVRVAEAKTE